MKLVYAIILCGLLLFTSVSNASYIGVFEGNDNIVQGQNCALALMAKIESGYFVVEDNVTYMYSEYCCTGLWATTEDGEPFRDVDYISIKAGNAYALFSNDNDWRGTFELTGLDCKDISHISFWKESCTVPIPPSLLLFASGICGLYVFRKNT